MDSLNEIKATRIYQEHRAKAQASLDRLHARTRRRRLLTFPVAFLAGGLIAYGSVQLNALWAISLLSFLHSPYFLAPFVLAGIAIVNVKAAQRYRGLLELQSRLCTLLVATNLLHARARTPGGRSPLEAL